MREEELDEQGRELRDAYVTLRATAKLHNVAEADLTKQCMTIGVYEIQIKKSKISTTS